MKTRFILLSFLLIGNFVFGQTTIWVSPVGKIKNKGTEKSPLTLLEAQARAAKLAKTTPVTVIVKGGTYELSTPLVFTNLHSGTPQNTITWKADDNDKQKPVFSGGRKLSLKWQAYKNGIWQAKIRKDITPFDQLFINNELQILARYPNYNPEASHLGGVAKDIDSPERVARWANPSGGYIHALHNGLWGGFHYKITGKTYDNKLITEGGWQNNRGEYGANAAMRFVENIFAELDTEGEWFFDATNYILYYYPPKNINLKLATITVPQIESLIRFEGTQNNAVSNISINGITFAHTLRTFMKTTDPLLRSDWTIYRGGSVYFQNAEHCKISNCVFSAVGGNAVFVNNYNKHIVIESCLINKIGASGVCFVGDVKAVRSPMMQYNQTQALKNIDTVKGAIGNNFPQDCSVRNCLMEGIGRVEKQSAGVTIDMSMRINVLHNTIYNVPRSGINIGAGTWGGHVIEGNDVFNTVLETSDHGAFNSWGRDRFWNPDRSITETWVEQYPDMPYWDVVETITIKNNRFRCDHGWDIDLDDGSSNYLIENNLCLSGGIKLREGYGRVVRNNITVNNSFHPHVWYKNSGDVIENNLFFTEYAPIGMPEVWGNKIDKNLLHQALQKDVLPASKFQEQSHQDGHSISANANFTNPATGNYQVAANSAAFTIGFKNFDMDKFGVQTPWLKAMAASPTLPDAISTKTNTNNVRSQQYVPWHNTTLKNIVGLGEVSAAGLMEEKGVLVLDASPKYDIFKTFNVQDGDIVLEWDGEPTNDVDTFQQQASKNTTPKTIGVWRNQKMVILMPAK